MIPVCLYILEVPEIHGFFFLFSFNLSAFTTTIRMTGKPARLDTKDKLCHLFSNISLLAFGEGEKKKNKKKNRHNRSELPWQQHKTFLT